MNERDPKASAGRCRGGRTSPRLWVPTTYFAEGFPYAVVNNLAEVLFKELGASLQLVGLTSLLHLPWNLKFLWGPLVDRFETKRRWLLGIELGLVVALAALALLAGGRGWLGPVAAGFVVLAVLAATHDIAIDGFYLEGLDERGQSRFVGVRAMAYKIASLVVRGPLVIGIGWIGWRWGLAAAAVAMAVVCGVHFAVLPRIERRGLSLGALFALPWRRRAPAARPARGELHYVATFAAFLRQPRIGTVLGFVLLFRAGESLLMKMKWPFLRDELKMTLEQYGFTNGTLGVLCSLTATLVGGWLIARHGLRRWLWPFVLAQNVLNLLYVGLAARAAQGPVGLALASAVIGAEHFGEGLGTAVFMVYLMRCCDAAYKAAHMAILTALMSVSFTLAGAASGFVAAAMGFRAYFAFSFIATLPAMALIPFLPYLDGRPRPAGAA